MIADPAGSLQKQLLLLSSDGDFAQSVRAAFFTDARWELTIVGEWLSAQELNAEITKATVVIVDINSGHRDELLALQRLANGTAHRHPFIVALQDCNAALVRELVQMRVSDLFIKPGTPGDLVLACEKLAQRANRSEKTDSKIHTFLPVAGGVGTTTLAIQSAMALTNIGRRNNLKTCLVDLNFHDGLCCDYLNTDPRLDVSEIEPKPERLDRQLLETMTSYHASGLAVIAAPPDPSQVKLVDQNVVTTLLNVVCQCFDQVIIDMPKTWYTWTDNVLLGSNELYLVSEASVPGLRRAKQLVEAISIRVGPMLLPRVIVNRFQSHFFNGGLSRSDLTRALGDSLGCTVPYNRRLVKEAIDRGVPLEEVQRSNNVAASIRKLMLPRKPESFKTPLLPSSAHLH